MMDNTFFQMFHLFCVYFVLISSCRFRMVFSSHAMNVFSLTLFHFGNLYLLCLFLLVL